MIELILGAVGRHIRLIEAVATGATHHRGGTAVQLDAHRAIHGGLGALDEAIQRIFQRPKPEALIDEISPLHLKLALGAQHIAAKVRLSISWWA